MACFHPIPAWRTQSGDIVLWTEQPDSISLRLPCGGCLGCRKASAQAWALRCQLELQRHKSAVFTTLTYDDEHVPITLPAPKTVLPLWVRAMRKIKGPKSIRFFASAEYGERTHRPHFHAILYGLDFQKQQDHALVQDTWPYGHTRTEHISPARIAYCAGYCQKKIGYKHNIHERVDPQTGEVYMWQPPYKLMSRRPGIGGDAREWTKSWRLYAVKDGHKMAVPRFLHEAWKKQATAQELEDLAWEKSRLNSGKDTSAQALQAAEIIAAKKHQLQSEKRGL